MKIVGIKKREYCPSLIMKNRFFPFLLLNKKIRLVRKNYLVARGKKKNRFTFPIVGDIDAKPSPYNLFEKLFSDLLVDFTILFCLTLINWSSN